MKRILAKTSVYIIIVLLLTWFLQFIPILFHMNVENSSVSSLDFASIFLKYYFKRCLLPTKKSFICIAGALLVISLEILVAELCRTE